MTRVKAEPVPGRARPATTEVMLVLRECFPAWVGGSRLTAWICLTYLAVGLLWAFLWHAPASVGPATATSAFLERLPQALFVVVTSILIFALYRNCERALRVQGARFSALSEATRDGIVALDADGHIAYANDRVAQMLGRSTLEMQGAPIERFLPSDQRDALLKRQDG